MKQKLILRLKVYAVFLIILVAVTMCLTVLEAIAWVTAIDVLIKGGLVLSIVVLASIGIVALSSGDTQ